MECFKCLGSGHFRTFSHIAGGKCFQCNGTGKSSAVRKVLAPAAAMPEVRTQGELRSMILAGEFAGMTFREIHACKMLASADGGLWSEWVRRGGERAFNAAA